MATIIAILFPAKESTNCHLILAKFGYIYSRTCNSKCAAISSDRYSFMDNAREGRKSEWRVISATEKRRIRDSLHGRVLRIDDFSGDWESRNNFTSGTGEQAGCSPRPALSSPTFLSNETPDTRFVYRRPERILVAVIDVFAPPWNKMIHSAKLCLKRPPHTTPFQEYSKGVPERSHPRPCPFIALVSPLKDLSSCNYASVFIVICCILLSQFIFSFPKTYGINILF